MPEFFYTSLIENKKTLSQPPDFRSFKTLQVNETAEDGSELLILITMTCEVSREAWIRTFVESINKMPHVKEVMNALFTNFHQSHHSKRQLV